MPAPAACGSACNAVAAFYLSVRDDGRGCAADPAPGFGLASMRQRARCLGAELSLRSRPGQGLALRLRMPLERGD